MFLILMMVCSDLGSHDDFDDDGDENDDGADYSES